MKRLHSLTALNAPFMNCRIPDHPGQLRTLYAHKYPKWWLQSFLAGVPELILGGRDSQVVNYWKGLRILKMARKCPKEVRGVQEAFVNIGDSLLPVVNN
eukprot:986537-Pelagomonas_calceolata.AAC.5